MLHDVRLSKRRSYALAGLAAILIAGCGKSGPPVVEVRGIVTYHGQPVTSGVVKFVPATLEGSIVRPASGAIAEDGSYSMQAFPDRSGSRPGEYAVAIVSYTGSFMDGTAKYVVPKQFADPKTSGLKASIPPKSPDAVVLNFDLID